MRPVLLLLALLAVPGCAHRVRVDTLPRGAVVTYRGTRGTTPVDLKVRAFGPRKITVRLAGYRTWEGRLPASTWYRGYTELDLILVEEHGAAGTWTPEDAP